MTDFRDTDAAAAFIATAESRRTSTEIMRAITFFARNEEEAVSLWDGDGLGRVANLIDIWENATGNGRISGDGLVWGDRSLDEVMAEEE